MFPQVALKRDSRHIIFKHLIDLVLFLLLDIFLKDLSESIEMDLPESDLPSHVTSSSHQVGPDNFVELRHCHCGLEFNHLEEVKVRQVLAVRVLMS